MKLKILQEPHQLLRAPAKEFPPSELKARSLQKIIKDLSETLRGIEVGIGLAAPQVGKSLRIFIVSEETLKAPELKPKVEKTRKYVVFINPKLLKTSKKKNILTEGCLSVSDEDGKLIFGQVERFEKVTVQAYDERGKKFTRGASGLFAQVIQHELDHLDGILFIDKALEIKKLERAKINFFGSSPWSRFYLEALEKDGWKIVELDAEPEVGVMAYYGKILSKEILEIPKKGILNIHHSLLPRWRGPSPVQFALLTGDETTGVTIIKTSKQVDAGDILAQREVLIAPEDTYLTLEEKLIKVGTKLLLETLPLYLGGKMTLQRQDESEATYSKKIKTEDGKINWSSSIAEINRQIRAFNPEPGTFTFWSGKRLIISEAGFELKKHKEPPGKVIKDASGFKIYASGGFLKPLKLKIESKKETTPSAFLHGHPQILNQILT